MDTPVIVLAGGTGTGKSTLTAALAEVGAAVIDADRVGHETLDAVREDLLEAFGAEIVDPRGGIDRRRLGDLVFSDPERLAALNEIVHPPLVAEIERRVDRLRQDGAHDLIVIDAALWPQFRGTPPVDLMVMATAPYAVRRERIEARDGISRERAEARLDGQKHLDAFLDDADAVLDTARSPEATRAALFTLIDERFGPRWRTNRP